MNLSRPLIAFVLTEKKNHHKCMHTTKAF